MKWILGVSLLVLAISTNQAMAVDTPSFMGGNELFSICSDKNVASLGQCYGYIAGVVDEFETFRAFRNTKPCLPEGVTGKQFVDVVMKYLTDNPAIRNLSASSNVTVAVSDAWGCNNK